MKTKLTLTLSLGLSLTLIGMALAQDGEGFRKAGARDSTPPTTSRDRADEGDTATDVADDEGLKRCIDELSSESFEARENAMATLRKAGKGAFSLLENAKEHEDPEVRWRASKLLKELRGEGRRRADDTEGDLPGFGRLRIRDLDIDGDGDPDVLIEDFLDAEELLKTVLGDREALRKQMQDMHRLRMPELKFPRLEMDLMDLGNGMTKGFRFETRPDGTVKMERLERGRWVPMDGSAGRAYGMSLEPAGEALRAQLEIPEGTGLVVKKIDVDGAGAKTDLQKYDIILTVNGEKVTDASAFEEIVGETPEGEDARLEVLRKAKKVEIELPVKRLRKF